jgi:hypothetical protein
MVRWSFSRAGFRLNSDNLLARLSVNRTEDLTGVSVPEMSLEQLVSQEPVEAPASNRTPVLQRSRILVPIEFAVSLKAYIDKTSSACPLCGHRDHEESSKDEKRQKSKFCDFDQSCFTRFRIYFQYLVFHSTSIFSDIFNLRAHL